MSVSNLVCETCGVEFAPSSEFISSRVLCPACAAQRRASLRASKGPATPGTASTPAARSAKASAEATPRRVARSPEEHHDLKKSKEAAQQKIVKIGWAVVGGLALITGAVMLFAKSTLATRQEGIEAVQKQLTDFVDGILSVDLTNEEALQQAKKRIIDPVNKKLYRGTRIEGDVATHLTKINGALVAIETTRSLKDQLTGIETQLGASPSVEVLSKLFSAVCAAELETQATEAGGALKSRYDEAVKSVIRQFVERLRANATEASSATTGEGLAPYGLLEDTLRTVLEKAMAINDIDTQTTYRPGYQAAVSEINKIGARLFDDAYLERVVWKDLLADAAAWTPVASPSFSFKFGGGVQLTNGTGDTASSGGLSYTPGKGWRDYVLDLEVKLDSGGLVFYTRVADKMDSKAAPAFTVGAKPGQNVLVELGKSYAMVVKVIGNEISVWVDGKATWSEDSIGLSKSRKGEPAIAALVGTNATITRLRVRHLR